MTTHSSTYMTMAQNSNNNKSDAAMVGFISTIVICLFVAAGYLFYHVLTSDVSIQVQRSVNYQH